MLTREQLLKPCTWELDVPELGGKILLRDLTGAERDEWFAALESSYKEVNGEKLLDLRDVQASFIARSIVGTDAAPIMTPDDVRGMSMRVIRVVFDAILKHNALLAESAEETEKN